MFARADGRVNEAFSWKYIKEENQVWGGEESYEEHPVLEDRPEDKKEHLYYFSQVGR